MFKVGQDIQKRIIKELERERKRDEKRRQKEEANSEYICTEPPLYLKNLEKKSIIPASFIDKFSAKLWNTEIIKFKLWKSSSIKEELKIEDDQKFERIAHFHINSTLIFTTKLSSDLFVAEKLNTNEIDKEIIHLKKLQKKDKLRMFLIPLLLVKENHWVIIHVNIYLSEIHIYDSYVNQVEIDFSTVMERIKLFANKSKLFKQLRHELLSKKIIESLNSAELKLSLKIIDWPKQQNEWDWGLYLCIFLYLLIQAVPFNIKIEKHSKKIRETIEISIKFNITDIDELFNP